MGARKRRGMKIAASILALSALPAAPLGSVDFIRGDANSDGEVSFADGYAIFDWLFRSEALPCLDAADTTDTGGIDIVDIAALMNHVVSDAFVPPPPFPAPGPDATPQDGDLPTDCESYGTGSAFEDPEAKVEVLDASTEGGEDGKVFVRLAVTSSVPLRGYYAALHVNADVVAEVSEVASSLLPDVTCEVKREGSTVSVHSVPFSHEVGVIPPGESVPVAEIALCLADGTPSGELEIRVDRAELVHAGTNSAIHPAREGGTLRVLQDITAATECAEPTGPPPPNAEYALTGGRAPPGGTIDVFLRMGADASIQGYRYSVDFDEEVLEAIETEVVWEKPDGSEYGFLRNEIDNDNASPGSAGVDEGFVIGVGIFDLMVSVGLTPGVLHDVVRFRFRVRPDTTALTTEIRFIDGGKISGQPVTNAISANGNTEYTRESASSFIFIGGFVGVVPDILTFIRGDSNGDERLDISDPLATLNYLFRAPDPPACYDAADANDSGAIDLADAVYTLNYLFLGDGALPPPHPEPGPDPTPDSMTCLTTSA